MQAALQLAEQAYHRDEVPVGAVIVYQGQIIASAHNRVQELKRATAHAEMLAIEQACDELGVKYLAGCTLYVTLEPCVMCAGAAHWVKLEKLVYAATDLKGGYSRHLTSLAHPRVQVQETTYAEQSGTLLKKFFQARRS